MHQTRHRPHRLAPSRTVAIRRWPRLLAAASLAAGFSVLAATDGATAREVIGRWSWPQVDGWRDVDRARTTRDDPAPRPELTAADADGDEGEARAFEDSAWFDDAYDYDAGGEQFGYDAFGYDRFGTESFASDGRRDPDRSDGRSPDGGRIGVSEGAGEQVYTYDDFDRFFASYYDGYRDGYRDDRFGHARRTGAGRPDDVDGRGFASGYHDGWYDRERGYAEDSSYYINGRAETRRDRRSDRERSRDRVRRRGDRLDGLGRGGSRADLERAAAEHRRSAKLRGTVQSVEYLRSSGRRGRPLIARLHMEDGRSAILNLGPRMSRRQVPFRAGDRTTFIGRRSTGNGVPVLMVHSIATGGDSMRIASRRSVARDSRARSRDRVRDRTRGGATREASPVRTMDRAGGLARSGTRRPQDDAGTGDARRSGDTVSIRGRVRAFRPAGLRSDRYRAWRIILSDGRSVLVASRDGNGRSLASAGLREGDRMVVRGLRRTVAGRPAILARQLVIDGRELDLSAF